MHTRAAARELAERLKDTFRTARQHSAKSATANQTAVRWQQPATTGGAHGEAQAEVAPEVQ